MMAKLLLVMPDRNTPDLAQSGSPSRKGGVTPQYSEGMRLDYRGWIRGEEPSRMKQAGLGTYRLIPSVP